MPNHPADARDFAGDSEERADAALQVAGTTDPVDVHIKDWGEFEGDYSQQELDAADGAASARDEDGMGFSSLDEIARQYDTLQYEDIKIIDRD